MLRLCRFLAAMLVASIQFAPLQAGDLHLVSPFVFRDVAEEAGVPPATAGIQAHGAGWGDIDGDGWADLYVGTFHDLDTQPNLLFGSQAYVGSISVDPAGDKLYVTRNVSRGSRAWDRCGMTVIHIPESEQN